MQLFHSTPNPRFHFNPQLTDWFRLTAKNLKNGILASAIGLILCSTNPTSAIQNQPPLPPNTQEESIPFTPPEKALEMMELPEGFSATLFAAEPDIHQPIAVTTDERGRLWVVECHTYSDRKTNYDMTLNDRVVIFEDTDNDGKFDKKTVFWDRGKKLTGIELGFGGVWLTAAPEFIFIPDANRDDKPDGPPIVLLDGFEDDTIRHNIVNGLRWGPDNWLYSRHGIQATSFVGKPGSSKSKRTPMNCAIWRYHPVEHRFEVVAEGGTNPWGFDYDKHGEMFMINTVIGHLFHIVPGARYRRMYGAHFNPHTYQVIEQTADHFHWDQGEEHWAVTKKEGMSSGTDAAGGGHAHTGLMIYQGDNWPEKYDNTLFTANFHGRRLNNDSIHREGNSYVAHHEPDTMKTKDPWFRGVEMIYGPDGGVFLLDWSDIGECHENDGIHRTSGRIFKITYQSKTETNRPPFNSVHLNAESNEALIERLWHKNAWYFRKARRILAERSLEPDFDRASVHEPLISTLQEKTIHKMTSTENQLRALWTLYSTGGLNDEILSASSQHPNEHIRAWAVRLMVDGGSPLSKKIVETLVNLSKNSSTLVRLYVASSLRHFSLQQRFQIATNLSRFADDASDRVQPHMIWFGIEPVIVSAPEQAIELATQSQIPLVTENIIRRLTLEIESNPQWVEAILENVLNGSIDGHAAVSGMHHALSGWKQVKEPKNWKPVVAHLSSTPIPSDVANSLSKLGIVFSDGVALNEIKRLVDNNHADLAARRKAIETWAETKPEGLSKKLKSLIRDRALTTSVLRAAVHCEDPAFAAVILNQMKHMDPQGQSRAIETLISREAWAVSLLSAIGSGKVPKQLVTAYHAERMYQMNSESVQIRLEKFWGKIERTPKVLQDKIVDLSQRLSPSVGEFVKFDGRSGRRLFEKNCSNCHSLYGNGGNTGPDLTGSDRKNLNYLLSNILNPNGSVAEAYRASLIQLEDGRFISGLVISQTKNTMSIQTPEEVLNIAKADIEEIKLSKKSVMPEGLMNNLTFQEKADLIGYLMSPNQVSLDP